MDVSQLSTLAFSNDLVVRNTTLATNAAAIHSMWTNANSWGTGTIPLIAGRSCNNTTAGALPLPSGGAALGSGFFPVRARHDSQGQNNHIAILDRLVDYGGIDATLITPQALGAVALPRHTSGENVQVYLEVFTASASASAGTVTISYTNTAGTALRTGTLTLAASWAVAQRVFQFQLEQGDSGVQSVQSLTFGTGSTNAGNIGVVLAKPMFNIPCYGTTAPSLSASAPYRDIFQLGWNSILTTACLSAIVIASNTSMAACNISYSLALHSCNVCCSIVSCNVYAAIPGYE